MTTQQEQIHDIQKSLGHVLSQLSRDARNWEVQSKQWEATCIEQRETIATLRQSLLESEEARGIAEVERDKIQAALIEAIEMIGTDMHYVPTEIEQRLLAAAGLPARTARAAGEGAGHDD